MRHPVRAKKQLGQHFLNDVSVARRTVEALLEKDSIHPVIEIGPGTGMLTDLLIEAKANFVALDVDRDSVAYLRKKHPSHASQIMEGDFLEADLTALAGAHFNVIGNFPYNISSQIMFRVLAHRNQVQLVVGMFQREVAMRLAEPPGSKTYGILSVLLQAWYKIEYLFTVHENVFTPPPKVKSAVIRLVRNERSVLDCDEQLFTKVVKTTFNQRRKTIRNSLKPLLPTGGLSHPLLEKRPEQLSVAAFEELTVFVQQHLP